MNKMQKVLELGPESNIVHPYFHHNSCQSQSPYDMQSCWMSEQNLSTQNVINLRPVEIENPLLSNCKVWKQSPILVHPKNNRKPTKNCD